MIAVPEIAPPVLKPLPEQDEAQAEPPVTDQVSVVVSPCSTGSGFAEREEVHEPGHTPVEQLPPLVGPSG